MQPSRSHVIAELKRWAFEPTDLERRIAERIRELEVQTVPRADQSTLFGMEPAACWRNSSLLASRDPSGRTKVANGWLVDAGSRCYVRHAVVDYEEGLICVTPMPIPNATIPFIRDDNLQHDGKLGFTYWGETLTGVGVRADPEAFLKRNRIRLRDIGRGVSLNKVLHPDYGLEN